MVMTSSACDHTTSSRSAMGSLREVAARIEPGMLRELPEELALAFVQHGGIHDLHDRIQVALAAAGPGQALLPEAQLASRRGARRDLEVHGAGQRRHLYRRAERRLPRRERQVEIEVVVGHAEQAMGMKHDVDVQVPVAPAIDALAALPAQAKALAVRGALRDARLDLLRHLPRVSRRGVL